MRAGLRVFAIQPAQRFKGFLFFGIFRRARSAPTSRDLIDFFLDGHALDQVCGALFGGKILIAIGGLSFLRKTERKQQDNQGELKYIVSKMHAVSSCTKSLDNIRRRLRKIAREA
jgi:hypothetical protein